MSGIVGLITRTPREQAERELHKMVRALNLGPSDVTGTWIEEDLGLYLGWVYRKGSFSENMPVCNERGDVSLIFSGEEFSEPGYAGRPTRPGNRPEAHGASYLVHLYEDDPAFPAGLNGKFHGFLIDRTRQRAMLFNDRYGTHRIYYHQAKEAFYFAGEAKAILKVRPELRRVDPRGMGEFVACGCVLEDRTLFAGLHALPPASSWTFRNAAIERKEKYFRPQEWEDQAALEPETYYQELRKVFSRNLPRYFNGRERIGMSLTAGLDSRMIMAWQKSPPGALPCYSFGGMYRDSQDVVIAQEIAKACGQTHQVIPIGKEFLSRFPEYAERTVYLSDACSDVSLSPLLCANEQAAKLAPVRMTGNYGGELLRLVSTFKLAKPASGVFSSELMSQVPVAAETYANMIRVHPLSFIAFHQVPLYHYAVLALEQSQVSVRTPFLDNELVQTVFRAPESAFSTKTISWRLIADGNSALGEIRTDQGLAGPLPAFSRNIQNFATKAEYAYDYGMPQWMAKVDRVLSPLRPERLFLGRQKYYHFRVWYRDALASYVREMLLDSRTLSRPYLNRGGVEALVRGHLKGNQNHTTAIHKLLTLELIHRLFVD